MLMQIGTMPMTRTRVDDDGNVTTGEVRADDHGNGKLYLGVDADIEVGDIVEYKLPNGKPRTMKIVKHDVMQAPGGMRMDSDLDHTVCEYEVVSAKPSRQPKRVNIPGLHESISDASGAQFADGHYDEAIFTAFKAVEDRVKKHSGTKTPKGASLSGKPLMSTVFHEQNAVLDITTENADTDQKADEAEGFKFLFMGGAQGIRNTRGHGPDLQTDEQEAREMLALASLLMRRLDRAEDRMPQPKHKRPLQNLAARHRWRDGAPVKPLGDYEAFRRWSGNRRAWGPDGSGWRAWFGGNVVDGLCEVLDEHFAAPRGRDMRPAAIGCVPWLTSEAVVDRLLKLNSCCVVIDKGASTYALDELNAKSGFPNGAISRLAEMMPAVDGAAPLTIGPYTPRDATLYEIEAVRVAGWRREGHKPLVHAKVLVLGQIGWITYDTPYGEYEGDIRFEPQRVWWGSANWTGASSSHLEVGFVCDDPKLVNEAADFVADMIAFSEPITTQCPGPEPNLVEVGYDNEAMAQAAAEMDEAHEGYDE